MRAYLVVLFTVFLGGSIAWFFYSPDDVTGLTKFFIFLFFFLAFAITNGTVSKFEIGGAQPINGIDTNANHSENRIDENKIEEIAELVIDKLKAGEPKKPQDKKGYW